MLENSITLTTEDVEISSQDIPGWLVANSGGITVALDVTITDKLRQEGVAREIVNRIQNLRKDSGFEVTDKIIVHLKSDATLNEAIKNNEKYIKDETLASEIIISETLNDGMEIEFDSIKTQILILNEQK